MKRNLLLGGGIAALATASMIAAGACVLGAPRYEGPRSDHFDGDVFHNHAAIPEHGPLEFVRWQLTRDSGPWRDWTPAPNGAPPPRRVDGGQLRATFVNHATILVQIDGVNVLTDPIWSERASPFSWVGPKRVRPPGIRFEDLPPIDVVLISHNHYDHFDLPTLERLAQVHHPRILVGLGNKVLLDRAGISGGVEVDWWNRVEIRPGVSVVGVPVQHFSGRSLWDRNHSLWTGYALEAPSGRVYFGGDTGYGPHFRQARERLGPIRLAVLPIGAYRPVWFMRPVHVSPSEAVDAHVDLDAETSLAMHFGTFRLADDGQHEPVRELANALGARGLSRNRFWVLDFGEGRNVP